MDERELVEEALRNRVVRILVCTSTLAAGLSLMFSLTIAFQVSYFVPCCRCQFAGCSRYHPLAVHGP
jgi:hypothetical protein